MPCLGGDVPDTHCEDDPPPTEEACDVACSADCVVGSWSSWSSCSHSCATKTAEGKQSRSRTVLAIPGKGNLKIPLIILTLLHMWGMHISSTHFTFQPVRFFCLAMTDKAAIHNRSMDNRNLFIHVYPQSHS